MTTTSSNKHGILFTVFGLNRAGRILYTTLFIAAIPALTAWFVLLPRLRFHEEDERLFRAARHGDVAGVERSLAAGARVNAAAPIDGKTALFRAAVFGHADAVRVLLEHGADPARRGNDGRTALEMVLAVRAEEHDRSAVAAFDRVESALRRAEPGR
jgi:hypothetical protein